MSVINRAGLILFLFGAIFIQYTDVSFLKVVLGVIVTLGAFMTVSEL